MKTAIHPVPSFGIASNPSGAELMHLSGALVLVLVIIIALAWMARRSRWVTQRVTQRVKASKLLTIVATHSLGQRERLVVVEMADKQLLLGVTATKISRLAIFDKLAEESDPAQQSNFQSLLHGRLTKSKSESEQ